MEQEIKRLLRTKKMTQAALADAVGIRPGFLSEILSGKKNPSLRTLRRIAEVLEVDYSSIISTKALEETMQHAFALRKSLELRAAQLPPENLREAVPSDHPGFGESDVELFDHESPNTTKNYKQKQQVAADVLAMAQLLCPLSRTLGLLRATRSIAQHGIIEGDFIVIDLRRQALSGDLVAVQLYDTSTAAAVTCLRYVNSGQLLPLDNPRGAISRLDDPHARVAGTIEAIIRAPQLLR